MIAESPSAGTGATIQRAVRGLSFSGRLPRMNLAEGVSRVGKALKTLSVLWAAFFTFAGFHYAYGEDRLWIYLALAALGPIVVWPLVWIVEGFVGKPR